MGGDISEQQAVQLKYLIEGLDCASCAAKMEATMHKEGISYASVNFASKSVFLMQKDIEKAQEIIERIEPGVILVLANKGFKTYELKGLDADCASNIVRALKEAGFQDAIVNFTQVIIKINPKYLRKVQKIITSIEPTAVLREVFSNEDNASYEVGNNMKRQLLVIAVSLILMVIGMVFQSQLRNTPFAVGEYLVFLTSYILVGWPVLKAAVKNSIRGNMFDENFLMTVATLGAIAVNQLPEAVGVMLFYYVGEFFQDLAVNRSRRSIKDLMDIRPEYANLKINGNLEKVAPETVNVGDVIVIKPGEKVPLDGVVTDGTSFLDTSALTGESVPRKTEIGEQVLAGTVNTSGLLTVEVTKAFEDSSVAKILDLVENAGARKAQTEKFITKFSRYYTPAVVFGALALAIIPPVIIPGAAFSDWVYRALILLVISCPCALVVSIPLGYFGGIGGASKRGILIKGANLLESLTNVHTVVLDKTGTLTKGVFKVASVMPQNGFSQKELLEYAAYAEANSNHPIAKSIMAAYEGQVKGGEINSYEEIPGHGVKVTFKGKQISAGNERMLQQEGIAYQNENVDGTVVYIAVDGIFAGYISISDEIKSDAAETIAKLKKPGIQRTVMLTGDDITVARKVASKLGIDVVVANLLPEDKVAKVEELMAEMGDGKMKLAFVGDGINDAPVITRADIGVAMGGLGSDAAIEAADVVIMDDAPSKLVTAVGIANRTKRIIIQNIILALTIKGIFVAFGAFGMATMWEAVFADVGVALLAILNATRALSYKEAV